MKKMATLFSDYKLAAQKRLDEVSLDRISLSVRRFIDFAGDLNIDEITLEDAELYHSFLVEDGVSKATANDYVKDLGNVFKWAVARSKTENNPFVLVKRFKITQKPVKVYTLLELRQLLEATRGDEIINAYFWQALNTLRKGEIMNLTVSDIDFKNKAIIIQPKYKTQNTWVWQPKNRKVRIVPLADITERVLVNRINNLPVGQPYVNLPPERYRYLISRDNPTERQRKKPLQNFDRSFRRLRYRASVKGDFHELRKTGITMMLENGGSIHVIQAVAGHSSLQTTERYIGLKPDYLSGALDPLNRAVSSVG